MANDVSVIDHFLDVYGQTIDSGFGLIAGDVGYLVTVLIGIDGTLAGLAWALGEEEVLQVLAKKVLPVGFFALLLNNWKFLAKTVFDGFAALGLKASGATLSYQDFLHPGRLAHAGVEGAQVLLDQFQRLSGFPKVFSNLSEVLLLTVAILITLLAFFILAILLFLAVIEFKLTTLKGFILVPFALWKGTAFIAEPVLGQVVTSGVRILVFAVITGIGTRLYTEILPTDPAQELSLQDTMTILLAAMTVAGLAFAANRLAGGLTSGAPQLGLGAAAAPVAMVAGTMALAAGGAGMAARAASADAGAGGGGLGRAMGGATPSAPASPPSPPPVPPAPSSPASGTPAWAERLRQQVVVRATDHLSRDDGGGGSAMRPQLKGDEP
ncbi:P-type conjugative transfer protein TrbL [Nitrospirillum iridis]|uniref:Type IV secretion system protein TrbL n=1 Tax=Nitrospirillum iridis TaxID=765888 RepID=A0A7X0EHK3_9PROT|nr:P-type conjugative transfer protein TrbL [Nitrospirillum iridis]MBB6255226.1 type IV secretion system protein TrbL [Nitrospirillum iridis]